MPLEVHLFRVKCRYTLRVATAIRGVHAAIESIKFKYQIASVYILPPLELKQIQGFQCMVVIQSRETQSNYSVATPPGNTG